MAALQFKSPHGTLPNPVREALNGDTMPQSAKKLLKETLENLPDDATVEEAIERLLFLAKIEQGIAEANSGQTLSHDEVRSRLNL